MPKKSPKSSSAKHLDPRAVLIDLANMRDDGAAHFRARWKALYQGYKDSKLHQLRDELQLLWAENIPVELNDDDTLKYPVPNLSAHAREQKEGWEGSESWHKDEPLQQFICDMWLKDAGKSGLLVDWENRRLKPDVKKLPIILVWGCLQNADRLAFCHNSECVAPFFVGKRKDQQFCSDECAAPAKREAKLRWWRANRAGAAREKDPGQM